MKTVRLSYFSAASSLTRRGVLWHLMWPTLVAAGVWTFLLVSSWGSLVEVGSRLIAAMPLVGVRYCEEGADELVFLDITATTEKRKTLAKLVREISVNINIPFTVGGGINSISDVSVLLENGADKVSINSSAVKTPSLINDLAKNFGRQCVVLAIDAKIINNDWRVVTHGGRNPTNLSVQAWVKESADRGAGEILLTSMENDGTKKGYATELTRQIAEAAPVPVIASGGAGKMEDFAVVFEAGKADAALAASIFHSKEISIRRLKKYLTDKKIPVRI